MSPRAERPRRHSFTAEYKLQILAEYEAAQPGERDALLRRDGLHSPHLVEWRRARDAGPLAGLSTQPQARKRSPEQLELEKLRARAERAEAELDQGGAGRRGKSTRALGTALRERGLRDTVEEVIAPVAQTWATLLDEGTYLCSMSTTHRLLRTPGQSRERRRQATRPGSSPSCWPPRQETCGRGKSPSCADRNAVSTTTSTW